jgi:predicted lipoprotein with Yx(FWY)xxD motif
MRRRRKNMHLPKHLLAGVTVVMAMAATTTVALAATHSTTGPAVRATHAASGGAKVAVANSGLGRILVDGRGHTLYLFTKDEHGKSACSGKCAAFWPPLLASGKTLARAGAKTSLLGTAKRPDGRLQVTYNHHPLYTFVKDARKGQTSGEGLDVFGAEWYAVSAAGAKIEKDANASSPDPTSGGYGY